MQLQLLGLLSRNVALQDIADSLSGCFHTVVFLQGGCFAKAQPVFSKIGVCL